MKKTLIFAGMLSIGYAYAQRGNVGINTTSPNATLEVKVADANASNDTNQGVLIPKLSKTRVAAIADGKLVKGTLVFVEGITYAGTNAKVVDINADGFYYYNGTKWVKVEGSVLPSGNVNGQVLKWNGSSWIVGTDNDTKYTAGTGLSLSGTTFSANPAGIALGGDVTGNANVNKVTKIQGRPVDGVTVPTAGQVLKWIDNQWKPANDENTNTQYSAGTGLNLTGTAFSVNYGTTAGTAVQGNDTRVNNGQTAFSWGNHATAGYLKTLPIASATQLGGVKVGTNLNITADGVLSATDTNTTYTAGNGLTLTGTEFSLPIATSGTGNVVTGITQTANGITVTKANVVDTNTTYTAGTGITISGTNNAIAVNPSGVALGGDVTGNANANTVAKIQGRAVANTAPTNGQVLKWNQAENIWKPANDDNTNTTYAGSTSVILSSGSFQRAALTGDVTSPQNSNALTISPNAVTSDKIANGTIKGEDIAPATITADKLVAGVIPTDTNTNIYTNDGTIAGDRVLNTGGSFLTIKGNVWNPLVINSEVVPTESTNVARGGIAVHHNNLEKRVEFATTKDGDIRLWADGDRVYVKRNTGNVGIGTVTPATKLDVAGNIKSSSLAGTGDRVVLADATGVLKAGTLPATSVSGAGNLAGGTEITVNNGNGSVLKNVDLSINSVSGAKITNGTITANKLAPGVIPTDTNTNIYTNDGTLSGARTVNTQTHSLEIKGNSWFPLVVNSTNTNGGGVSIHPNNPELRSELSVESNGNFRIYQNGNGDVMKITKANGNVGIGTGSPSEKLEVNGSIKSSALSGTGNRNVVADSTGKLVIGQAATPIRTVTASTTIAATDDNGYVYVNTSTAVNITIPANLPVGFSCVIVQKGTGQVTIVAGTGATAETARGTKTRARHSAVGIIKDTATTFTITGDAVN